MASTDTSNVFVEVTDRGLAPEPIPAEEYV